MYHKRLAELIARKRGEEYADVVVSRDVGGKLTDSGQPLVEGKEGGG